MGLLEQVFPREYGGYKLTGLLGSGGSADVYRASLPGAGKDVAVRRLARVASDRLVQSVLLEESRIWVSLRHPNIVSVIDIGQHEGDWFLVLELVDGASVDQCLHAIGPMEVPEALCIVERTALALAHSHALVVLGKKMEVVHRDVKPANILVSLDGEVKLTDFGIARANDRIGRTKAGYVKGSLHYLSPEQVRREPLDLRTDLFSLGCTLHKCLTGMPLIDLPKEGVIRVLQRGDIPAPPTNLPPAVRELLGALTAARPDNRPANATDVSKRIREILSPASPETVQSTLARRVSRTRVRSDNDMINTSNLLSEQSESNRPPVGSLQHDMSSTDKPARDLPSRTEQSRTEISERTEALPPEPPKKKKS